MGRKPCCEKVGLKRGPWTAEEDAKLVSYINSNGICCWRQIPKLAGLLRCGKSCRLRWTNYLRPDLKRGIFTEEEENLILDLHATLGNRWSRIAAQLPGRTDNEIKNYWNTRLKKRLRSQGLDPATHLPLDSNLEDDDSEGDDDESSEASGTKVEPRKTKMATKPSEPAKPVRQPRGPKPAPQLKMCQGEEGLVLLKTPKLTAPSSRTPSPGCKSEDDSDSNSTVTTKSDVKDDQNSTKLTTKLISVPSFPEAELWKCIKPTPTSSDLLEEWDSYSLLLNPYPAQPTSVLPKTGESMTKTSFPHGNQVDSIDVHLHSFTSQAENFGGVFQAACYPHPQAEMGTSWAMDVEMGQPGQESLFAPNFILTNPAGSHYYREVQQPEPSQDLQKFEERPSQDLQKLAALLDLL